MSSGLSYQDFGGAEVTAVESGRIEAALLVEPPVLFLLIRFRGQTDRVALSPKPSVMRGRLGRHSSI